MEILFNIFNSSATTTTLETNNAIKGKYGNYIVINLALAPQQQSSSATNVRKREREREMVKVISFLECKIRSKFSDCEPLPKKKRKKDVNFWHENYMEEEKE